ncbi:hypothetical protein CONPUDRAFT_170444 [Coniophora puteana RWD-64-598 SS2]|uniref:Uncharacterized protein n=1 Tax=Coniophora puteana (strain RWD-64-598) TaxID=741705 RepID=R7SDA3_CONPW|nr:uncharacterized protein CONPUDRAFT_170444 [Coniophora puteana RWD-64-598 SS2]EIW73722.1 hypothetical protein CONPUDRAFT_170444 [Coniophora puteana RWD-64-598 SS2]
MSLCDKQDENVEKATDASKDGNISKRKKKYNKKTLPSHANTNRRWARVFIPTFFAWLARQKDVWGPSNNKVLNALRNIWRVVYNEELPPEQDAIDGAVFNLCKQRANEWRSNFGSTASAVLSLSFTAEDMYGYEDAEADRVEYARGLLVANVFMFENVPDDDSPPSGNFRGPLYAATLATHRAAIRGRVKVPEYDDDEEFYAPRGAMTLACAAAERACQLAADGQLGDLEAVVDDLVTFQASGKQSCPIKKGRTSSSLTRRVASRSMSAPASLQPPSGTSRRRIGSGRRTCIGPASSPWMTSTSPTRSRPQKLMPAT